MSLVIRYRKIIVILLILAMLTTYTVLIATREYGDFSLVRFDIGELSGTRDFVYLKVGETIDIKNELKEAATTVTKRHQIDGHFRLSSSGKSVIAINNTKVTAVSSGLGRVYYNYKYVESIKYQYYLEVKTENIEMLNLNYIVLPEESEYIAVYSINDITSENKAFILKNDIVVTELFGEPYVLEEFNGVLLNPDGYMITIEESSELKALFRYNYGVIDGIKLNAQIIEESYNLFLPICGLTVYNSGVIKDCELEAEIEMHRGGIFLENIFNSDLRCAYTIREHTNNAGFLNYNYQVLKNSDILFTFSGATQNIKAENSVLYINTNYKQVILD